MPNDNSAYIERLVNTIDTLRQELLCIKVEVLSDNNDLYTSELINEINDLSQVNEELTRYVCKFQEVISIYRQENFIENMVFIPSEEFDNMLLDSYIEELKTEVDSVPDSLPNFSLVDVPFNSPFYSAQQQLADEMYHGAMYGRCDGSDFFYNHTEERYRQENGDMLMVIWSDDFNDNAIVNPKYVNEALNTWRMTTGYKDTPDHHNRAHDGFYDILAYLYEEMKRNG